MVVARLHGSNFTAHSGIDQSLDSSETSMASPSLDPAKGFVEAGYAIDCISPGQRSRVSIPPPSPHVI